MLALLILSIGLLGITGMQLSGLKYANEAYLQSVATARLSEMMERLRANITSASYEGELRRWNNLNAKLLPNGEGNYTCQNNFCTITIKWTFNTQNAYTLSAQVH